MASQVYIKSFIWLIALGGIGYGLMQVITPSEQTIQAIKAQSSSVLTDNEKKKIAFMQQIQRAAKQDPIYLPPSKTSTSKRDDN